MDEKSWFGFRPSSSWINMFLFFVQNSEKISHLFLIHLGTCAARNVVYTSSLVEKTTTEHEDALWVLETHLVVWMSRINGNTCLDIEV